jgi:cytochrome c oxidase subunit 2
MIKKIVLIGLLVCISFMVACSQEQEDNSLVSINNNTENIENSQGEIKNFHITARRYEFEPNTLTVNKGDIVVIEIVSLDVTHGFAIDEYGINEVIPAGKTTIVEFTADKSGKFNFYCSVYCGSGHTTMNGELLVE